MDESVISLEASTDPKHRTILYGFILQYNENAILIPNYHLSEQGLACWLVRCLKLIYRYSPKIDGTEDRIRIRPFPNMKK